MGKIILSFNYISMVEEEIKYSYDLDYFVKWSHGKTYEMYDRDSGRGIDFSNMSTKRESEIVAHAYFYGITTDEKTFYKKIQEAVNQYDKEHGL